NLDNDADVIVVFGGINDYMADIELGEINSTDAETFNGALNALYAGLKSKYTNKPIWILTPLQSETTNGLTDEENAKGLTLEDYVNAMLARRIFGINVLDLYHLSNINTETNPDDRVAFFHEGDGVHPNELGHKRIADMLISVISGKDLFTDVDKTADAYINSSGVLNTGNPGTHVTKMIEIQEGYTYM